MTWTFAWVGAAWRTVVDTLWPPPAEPPFDQALRAFLLADTTIAAAVSTRIFPQRLPQNLFGNSVPGPALTYSRITARRGHHLRGVEALRDALVQIDSWAKTYDAATALGLAVQRRLDGFSGVWTQAGSPPEAIRVQMIGCEEERDLTELEIGGGLYRHSADYRVRYGPAH